MSSLTHPPTFIPSPLAPKYNPAAPLERAAHPAAPHPSTHPTSPPPPSTHNSPPPQLKLDVLRIPLRPTDAELSPLPWPRDTLPEGRVIHRLILTYKLSLAEAGKVTPTLPMLNK